MRKRLAFFVACATAITLILDSSAAHAVPITYQGTLNDGQPEIDTIGVGDPFDPENGRYWTFSGIQGDVVTVMVRRQETAFDPVLFIYEGTFADTGEFAGDLFGGAPGFLCLGDDEIPDPGPQGDPLCVVTLTLPGTGQYTAIVGEFASGSPGDDGVYDYAIAAFVGPTRPIVMCLTDVASLWPPNHELVDVGFSVTAVDDEDPDPTIEVQVFSDEDDVVVSDDAELVFTDELDLVVSGEVDLVFSEEEQVGGAGNHSPDAKDDAETLRLRSERAGNNNGRTYLIVVTATDAAGDVGFNCCTVVVPHSKSKKAMEAAIAQAALAEAFCREFGDVPLGFVLVGDGPEVGPKQ